MQFNIINKHTYLLYKNKGNKQCLYLLYPSITNMFLKYIKNNLYYNKNNDRT